MGFHTVAEVLGFIATLITIGDFAARAYQRRKRAGMRTWTDDTPPPDTLSTSRWTGDLPARTVSGRAQLRRFLVSYPVFGRLKALAPQVLVWASVAYVVFFIVFRPSTAAQVFREIGAALLDLRILIPLSIVVQRIRAREGGRMAASGGVATARAMAPAPGQHGRSACYLERNHPTCRARSVGSPGAHSPRLGGRHRRRSVGGPERHIWRNRRLLRQSRLIGAGGSVAADGAR